MPRLPRPLRRRRRPQDQRRRRRRPQDQRRRHAPEPPPGPAPTPPPAPPPEPPKTPRTPQERSRRLRRLGVVVLTPLGLLSAAYSYIGVYEQARKKFGDHLALGFPLLLDLLIAGASLMYLAGATIGQARHGWRIVAHAAVAGTIFLNAISSPNPGDVWWHIVGPIVWSVIVEMAAREVHGEWKATHRTEFSRIPRRLWLAGFRRSWHATIRMQRVGYADYRQAFNDLDLISAAIRLAHARQVQGYDLVVLRGLLRSGALDPRHIIPVLEAAKADSAGVIAAASQRILERERIAAEEAERVERERQERALAEHRRIAAERAEIAALERPQSDAEPEPGRPVGARESAPASPTRNAPDPAAADPGAPRPWTPEELAWLRERLDDAFAVDPTDAGKPSPKGLQKLAEKECPDLDLHTRPDVSVRGKVNKLWKAKQDAAADSNVRPISAAR